MVFHAGSLHGRHIIDKGIRMEELIHIVETLLTDNCCVTIPEFGAFMHQHKEAFIEGNILYPPHTTLSFNRQVNHSDGLVEQIYARKHKTDYSSARKMIHAAVEDLTRQLQERGEADLGRIGTMHCEEERYVFEPSSCHFLPQNLGLQPVVLHKQVENAITIRLRKDYLRYAAACIIGIGLLTISPRVNNDNAADYASMRPIDYTAIIASLHPAEDCAEKEPKAERGHFHIVVASLDKEAAKKECKYLIGRGYTEAIVIPYKKNLHRVVLASYTTKREALRQMEKTRKTTPFKRAWVYCE